MLRELIIAALFVGHAGTVRAAGADTTGVPAARPRPTASAPT